MNSSEKKFVLNWPRQRWMHVWGGELCSGVFALLGLASILVLPCATSLAQQSSNQTGTGRVANNPLRYESGRVDPSEMNGDLSDPILEQRRFHLLRAAKYKSINEKTEKLLKQVTELNAQVGSTNPESLTPAQLRMVADIEKLARSVKEEMRTPVELTPSILGPARPPGGSADRQ